MVVNPIVKTDPDPTVAVKEALTLAIKNLDDKITQRFDLNDRATSLAREERRLATSELAKANSDAIKAALATTTEAAIKLERSFVAVNAATNEKIDRLTERINVWEGRDINVIENKQDRVTDRSQTTVIISVVIAAASVLIAFASLFLKR